MPDIENDSLELMSGPRWGTTFSTTRTVLITLSTIAVGDRFFL